MGWRATKIGIELAHYLKQKGWVEFEIRDPQKKAVFQVRKDGKITR